MLCIVSLNRLRRYRFGGGDCCGEQLSPNWPVLQQQPSAALASAVSWSLLCKHTRRRPRRRQRAWRLLSLLLLVLSPLFRLFCLREKCSVAVFLSLFTPVAAAAVVEISAVVTTHSLLLLIATRWSLSLAVVVVEVVVWWSQQLAFSLRCPALLCCRGVSAFLKLKPFCLRHCNELVSWIRHTILILTLADFFLYFCFWSTHSIDCSTVDWCGYPRSITLSSLSPFPLTPCRLSDCPFELTNYWALPMISTAEDYEERNRRTATSWQHRLRHFFSSSSSAIAAAAVTAITLQLSLLCFHSHCRPYRSH